MFGYVKPILSCDYLPRWLGFRLNLETKYTILFEVSDTFSYRSNFEKREDVIYVSYMQELLRLFTTVTLMSP